MKKNNFGFETRSIPLIALWLCIAPGIALAQDSAGNREGAANTADKSAAAGNASAKPAATNTTAQILEELEHMRARIVELEAQLKAQSGTASAAESAAPSSPATASATAAAGGTLQADTTAPKKPAKQEPFSDADWTWLNGNPRTKEIFLGHEVLYSRDPSRHESTWWTSIIRPTIRSGGSSELFRSRKCSSSSSEWAATFTTTTFARG